MGKECTPEGLEEIWCEDVATAFKNLKPKQQDFLLQWISNGFNATKAYWDTYNKSATASVAANCGRQILRSTYIQQICAKMTQDKESDLVLIKKTYLDAMYANKPVFKDGKMIMEIEDHPTRAASAEKLARLNGQIIDKAERVHKFPEPVIFKNPDGEVYKRITFKNGD